MNEGPRSILLPAGAVVAALALGACGQSGESTQMQGTQAGNSPSNGMAQTKGMEQSNGGAAQSMPGQRQASGSQPRSSAGMSGAGDSQPITAAFVGKNGDKLGTAELSSTQEGVAIVVSVSGLSPGPHGFHIHQTGICSPPDFKSAGGHFNPNDAPHGRPSADRQSRHAGDMKNQQVDGSGKLSSRVTNKLVKLDQSSLLDQDGSALIIHAGEDDYQSQPSGAAGARVACAVISKPQSQSGAGTPMGSQNQNGSQTQSGSSRGDSA